MFKKDFIHDGCDVTEPTRKELAQSITEFGALLESAEKEQQLHSYFERHPYFLTWLHPHCHYAVSKPRLGASYIPDFILPEISSAGIEWVLVELEPVKIQLTTKSGQFAERVRGAIQQVMDWKRWLAQNRDQAIRPISKGGLGLEELDLPVSCQIIIGRRTDVDSRFNQLRADARTSGVQIITYDHVLDWAKKKTSMMSYGNWLENLGN